MWGIKYWSNNLHKLFILRFCDETIFIPDFNKLDWCERKVKRDKNTYGSFLCLRILGSQQGSRSEMESMPRNGVLVTRFYHRLHSFFPIMNLLHSLENSFRKRLQRPNQTYSSETEYKLFKWAFSSITIAMMTDVRIEAGISYLLSLVLFDPSCRRHSKPYFSLQSVWTEKTLWFTVVAAACCGMSLLEWKWVSKWEGDKISNSCMPVVERILVRYLTTARTSSSVLYSKVAKFSAKYLESLTSSYRKFRS